MRHTVIYYLITQSLESIFDIQIIIIRSHLSFHIIDGTD